MSDSVVSEDERFGLYFRDRVLELEVPEPPREAMWAAIAARRGVSVHPAASVAATVTVAAPAIASASAKGFVPRRMVPLQWAVPAAAALLFAGAGIGYRAHQKDTGSAPPQVATTPFNAEKTGDLVAETYLVKARALLASYTAEQRNGMSEAQADDSVAESARSMLQLTMSFLDSPMPMSEDRRKLLEDLRGILMQIATPSPLPDDAKMVEQSITKSQMMQRLAATLPLEQRSRGL